MDVLIEFLTGHGAEDDELYQLRELPHMDPGGSRNILEQAPAPAQKSDWDEPLEKRANTSHKITKVVGDGWTEIVDEVTGKSIAGFSPEDSEAVAYWENRDTCEVNQ